MDCCTIAVFASFFFPFFSFFSFLWNERERVSASPFAAESPIDPDRS